MNNEMIEFKIKKEIQDILYKENLFIKIDNETFKKIEKLVSSLLFKYYRVNSIYDYVVTNCYIQFNPNNLIIEYSIKYNENSEFIFHKIYICQE